MNLNKRIILGSAMIVVGMLLAVAMTFVYSYFITKFPEQSTRFDIIFGVGGGAIGLATLIGAFVVYTDDFGSGLER